MKKITKIERSWIQMRIRYPLVGRFYMILFLIVRLFSQVQLLIKGKPYTLWKNVFHAQVQLMTIAAAGDKYATMAPSQNLFPDTRDHPVCKQIY